MRIISGTHKGRRISPPKLRARPTTDFAKESLFNILSNETDIRNSSVIDLFSGSGAISFEFLSRGATNALSVEKDRKALNFIKDFSSKCQFDNHKIVQADVFAFIKTFKEPFDIIFADPPYNHKNLHQLPDLIMGSQLVHEGSLVIIEHGPETEFTNSTYLSSRRTYGNVNFSFFRP